MSTEQNPTTPIEIQGYVTDPKMVGYQMLTNYENIYWRSLVGNNDAWGMYEVLRGYCHQGNNTCKITVNKLMQILGIKQKRVITGRITKIKGTEYRYPGLIEILQHHKLIIVEPLGEGPLLRYLFHVNLTPRLLTTEQLSQLPVSLQKDHNALLQRCKDRQQEQESKRRPAKVAVTGKDTSSKQLVGGGDNLSPWGDKLPKGSDNLSPLQYPYNNTHITTTPTDEETNNNSGGPSTTNQDVVVVLTKQGISEKVAHRLAGRYSQERIYEKIEFLEYLKQYQPNKTKNPCGWLRKAIEEDYGQPDGFKSLGELEAEQAEQTQRAAEHRRLEAESEHRFQTEQARRNTETNQKRQAEVEHIAKLQELYGTSLEERELWPQVLADLELQMAETGRAQLAGSTLLRVREGRALVALRNGFMRDWVQRQLSDKIQRVLAQHVGQAVRLEFTGLEEAEAALMERQS